MTWHTLGIRQRLGWILVLSATTAGMGFLSSPSPSAEGSPTATAFLFSEAPLSAWKGSVSCASAACHNAGGPRGAKGSEFSTWATSDPHRNAYAVLLSERSRRIEANLHRGDTKGHMAETDALCLNCHVAPHVGEAIKEDLQSPLREGVACESCHGPSERWRRVHFLDDWRGKSAEEKKRYGMVPTKDLVERAKMCAGCHIGEGRRDVNHDLIAAGHPRLTFEYSGYLAILPKHWSEQEEKSRYPDLEARTWAIGQAASAQTALELLAYRASEAKPAAPGLTKAWPEFAEYDCFACHHDLQGNSWRQQPGHSGKPGSLSWGTWYMAMLPETITGSSKDRLPEVWSKVMDLKEKMRLNPDRAKIAILAQEAARELNPWAERLAEARSEGNYLDTRLREIARDNRKISRASWDGAAQLYLALAAHYHAQGDLTPRQRDVSLSGDLQRMRRALEFPRMKSSNLELSPPGFIKYDSPEEKEHQTREDAYRKALENFVQKQLDRRSGR